MTHRDITYYERRLADERRRAAATSCGAARTAHSLLADQYVMLLDSQTVVRQPDRNGGNDIAARGT